MKTPEPEQPQREIPTPKMDKAADYTAPEIMHQAGVELERLTITQAAEIERLKAELAEEKRRLDWLEKNNLINYGLTANGYQYRSAIIWLQTRGIRSAIDAAIQTEGK